MERSNKGNSDVAWEDLILQLTAFTHYLINNKAWFRRKGADSFLKGKQPEDYVNEAITRYLLHPEKYDPEKGELSDYLKYNIIRTLVGNDSRSHENLKSIDLGIASEDGGSYYAESLLPHVEEYFDEQIDYDRIISHIAKQIENDKIAENIFSGICSDMKRREIRKEFGISEKDYNNGIRRLETIFRRTAQQFDLEHIPYEHKLKAQQD